MTIRLEHNSGTPLYQQIVEQVRAMVLNGTLPAGYRLPPERKLADALSVNRTTILNAYRELKAEGLIGSHVGQGTVVLAAQESESTPPATASRPIWSHYLSDYAGQFSQFQMNDLLDFANRTDVISFATGMAAPECGPAEALRGIEERVLTEDGGQYLMHSPVEGFHSLRVEIAGYMSQRGAYCTPGEVFVTSGSQQGIELVAQALLNPGDIVVMEEPTYFPAIQVFKAMGARIMGVPVDEEGMQLSVLELLLQRYRPKLIYTVPTFHNPTGTELSMERRKWLMALSRQYRIPVVEDDAYGELRYDGTALPTLKSMDSAGLVIHLNTFSKMIYPGLRIGWVVADRKLVDTLIAIRQVVDIHTNCLSQKIVERFVASGQLGTHLETVTKAYRHKRDTMLRALRQYAPEGMRWTTPAGGYYIWVTLPPGVACDKLLHRAERHKVAFVPGTLFSTTGQETGRMRLNFTFAAEHQIEPGIRRLCEAIRETVAQEPEGAPLVERNPIV
ncbi:PLP-dependent aminotransferase family protein [Ruminococcaceae bacterium OttesenSCG-928-L11]|nr:PLP-dependent aminotransferase family protein [Ruminococcaceae bacterium OttesenSCG-928-L11]